MRQAERYFFLIPRLAKAERTPSPNTRATKHRERPYTLRLIPSYCGAGPVHPRATQNRTKKRKTIGVRRWTDTPSEDRRIWDPFMRRRGEQGVVVVVVCYLTKMRVELNRPGVRVQRVSILVQLVIQHAQGAPDVRVVPIAVAARTIARNPNTHTHTHTSNTSCAEP